MKTCEVCETEFEPKTKNHRYCTALCRDRARYVNQTEARRIAMNKYRADWKNKNKTHTYSLYRDNHLKKNFGITLEQYNEMLDRQNNSCAICSKSAEDEGRSFAVDHDHTTGEIYGLLCFMCNNRFIGKRRDPELYLKASEYLRQGSGLFVPDDKKKARRRKRRVLKKYV